jgi:hypothetical protein
MGQLSNMSDGNCYAAMRGILLQEMNPLTCCPVYG